MIAADCLIGQNQDRRLGTANEIIFAQFVLCAGLLAAIEENEIGQPCSKARWYSCLDMAIRTPKSAVTRLMAALTIVKHSYNVCGEQLRKRFAAKNYSGTCCSA